MARMSMNDIYRLLHEATQDIHGEDYEQCMKDILDYVFYGIEPTSGGVAKAVFMLVRPQIDANKAYSEAGKKGKPNSNQGETNGKPSVNQSETKVKPTVNQSETNGKPNEPKHNLNEPDPVDYTTEVYQSNQNLSNDYTVDFTESTENQKEKPLAKAKGKKKEPFFDDERLNEAFIAYLDMRKQIKKPATENAVQLARSKLMKLARGDPDTAVAILEQSIFNSWQGLFELKEQPTKKLTFNDYSRHDYDMDELRRRAKA